ncbi:hypothetical protein ACQ4WX_49045 [Streptomyces lasalocidi]
MPHRLELLPGRPIGAGRDHARRGARLGELSRRLGGVLRLVGPAVVALRGERGHAVARVNCLDVPLRPMAAW